MKALKNARQALENKLYYLRCRLGLVSPEQQWEKVQAVRDRFLQSPEVRRYERSKEFQNLTPKEMLSPEILRKTLLFLIFEKNDNDLANKFDESVGILSQAAERMKLGQEFESTDPAEQARQTEAMNFVIHWVLEAHVESKAGVISCES